MHKLIQKDKKSRTSVNQTETLRFILKATSKNMNFSNLIRWNSIISLTSLSSESSKTFINNRCILTGRKNSTNKFYKFSRITFLKLVRFGCIYGLKKSSW